jgi:hypothetical protein
MIATSAVVMFGLMYLNTYQRDHVFWSETRFYAAVCMGAAMAVIMLAYMFNMYPSKTINTGIFAGSAATDGSENHGECLALSKPHRPIVRIKLNGGIRA